MNKPTPIARIQLSDSDKLLIESFKLNISFQNTTDLPDVYYPMESNIIKWIMHTDEIKLTEIQKRIPQDSDLWRKNQKAGEYIFGW